MAENVEDDDSKVPQYLELYAQSEGHVYPLYKLRYIPDNSPILTARREQRAKDNMATYENDITVVNVSQTVEDCTEKQDSDPYENDIYEDIDSVIQPQPLQPARETEGGMQSG